jgi:hypothetical protein
MLSYQTVPVAVTVAYNSPSSVQALLEKVRDLRKHAQLVPLCCTKLLAATRYESLS